MGQKMTVKQAVEFYRELQRLCSVYCICIKHEDSHGAFIFTPARLSENRGIPIEAIRVQTDSDDIYSIVDLDDEENDDQDS